LLSDGVVAGVDSVVGVDSAGFVLDSSELTDALVDLRLSVIYQPEPLKTMPTG
jgi:hypothetical protein